MKKRIVDRMYVGAIPYAHQRHALSRLKERTGKDLSPREYMELCKAVKESSNIIAEQSFRLKGKWHKGGPFYVQRQVKVIGFAGKTLHAVYDKGTQLIVTFLNPSQPEEILTETS
jgi:hypothetical protein